MRILHRYIKIILFRKKYKGSDNKRLIIFHEKNNLVIILLFFYLIRLNITSHEHILSYKNEIQILYQTI